MRHVEVGFARHGHLARPVAEADREDEARLGVEPYLRAVREAERELLAARYGDGVRHRNLLLGLHLVVGQLLAGDLEARAVLFDEHPLPARFERDVLARRKGQHGAPYPGRQLLDVSLPCEPFGPAAERPPAAAGQQRRHGGDRRVFPGRGSQHAHPAPAGRLADVAPYALFVVAVYPAQQRKVLRRLLQQFRQLPVLRRAVEPLPEDRQFLFGGGSLEAGFEYFFDLVFETHVVFRVFRLVGVAGNNVSYGIDRKNERRTYNAGVFL